MRQLAFSSAAVLMALSASPASADNFDFENCTSTDFISSAFTDARVMSNSAQTYLSQRALTDHGTYETWFGGWDWSDASHIPGEIRGHVENNVRTIRDMFTNTQFHFNCKDQYKQCRHPDGTAAYDAYVDRNDVTTHAV